MESYTWTCQCRPASIIARTYIRKLCADTGCNLEDHDERKSGKSVQAARLDDDDDDDD